MCHLRLEETEEEKKEREEEVKQFEEELCKTQGREGGCLEPYH